MAGPWEQYQQPAAPTETGPWAQYASPDALVEPAQGIPYTPDAIPQQRRGGLKASMAGLADTVLGIVPQATAEVGYAGVRALEGLGLAKPGQAERGRKAVLEQYGTPVGTALGVTDTAAYQNEATQRLMRFIGEYAGKGADWLSQQTGLPKADVENMMFSLSLAGPKTGGKVVAAGGKAIEAAAPVAKQVATQVTESKPGQAVIKPLQERQARIQEANVAKSFENAAQIDAANLAVKHGIVIDPAVSNPTMANRIKSGLVKATNFDENASKINDARFTLLAKQDIGVPATAELNAKTFEQALDKHSKPYNVVRSIPQLAPDSATLNQINSLRIDRPAIGGEASAAAVNSLVDEALAKVAKGRSGAEIITDIRKLRKDANSVYSTQQKSGVPDPTLLAKADASIGVANALENLIEANVQDPKLLGELRKARSEMAKIYDYERATNTLTGRIDPQALVKMAREGKPLTGTAADIAKIAAVFPEVAQTGQTGVPAWAKGFTRSGTAGTLGMAAASMMGAPLVPGAVAGAGIGYVGGGVMARRMATPAYQAAHAVPRDFRPSVNNLQPGPKNVNNLRND